ncbi:FG-GAP-like repeat-containing protein, partial [Nocardioides sp.]|uniref:FG-GAP-like repeat-containing protein n=1 Tax=Nocardioides sp. TaxID=35761 RepID=UPI002726EB82
VVLTAAVVALLLVGAGIAYAVLGSDDDPDEPGTADPTSASTSGASSEPTSGDPSSGTTVAPSEGPVNGDLDGDGRGDLSIDYEPADDEVLRTTTWSSNGSTFVDAETDELGPTTGLPTWRVRGHLDDDDTEDVLTFRQPGAEGPVSVTSDLSGDDTLDLELPYTGPASGNDALADLDGDGTDDLFTLEVIKKQVVLTTWTFDGSAFGSPEKRLSLPVDDLNYFWIQPGDFNGDEVADLATVELTGTFDRGYPGSVEIRLGDGEGGFAEPVSAPFTSAQSSMIVRSGDFDADGSDELVVGDFDTRFVVLNVFDLDGDTITPRGNAGNLRNEGTAQAGPDLTVGDVDGDGYDDVVMVGLVREDGNARVLVGKSNGTTFTSSRWLAWDQLFADRENPDDRVRFDLLEDARW